MKAIFCCGASQNQTALGHMCQKGQEDMSSYAEGQIHQLANRLEGEGFTPELVTKLGQFNNFAGLRSVLSGSAKITPISEDSTRVVTLNETTIAVNLGAPLKLPFGEAKVETPHIGNGWVIVEKRADGLYVDGSNGILYLSKRQMKGMITGHEVRKELIGKPVLNANILDALLDNPHLIPEEWKKDKNGKARYVFFWATIFRDSPGSLCVRCLCFRHGRWFSFCYWLGIDWSDCDPAALLASS